ncbi:PIGR protein, partial [Polypterus senegalus]
MRYEQAEKFWCKTLNSTCYPLVSTDNSQKHMRMSIKDDRSGRKITVTMRSLMKDETGWYHCGIKALNFDESHPVYLTVTGAVESLVGPKLVTGKTGSSVSIVCLYSDDYRDRKKYWCKEDIFRCSELVTTNYNSEKERKSISDNKSSKEFTVIMKELKKEDEGLYQCGIKRTLLSDGSFLDETTSVYVHVKDGSESLYGPSLVTGVIQEFVIIKCHYSLQYTWNTKFWCSFSELYNCLTLVKTDETKSNDRISITDDKTQRVFTVTMTGLREDDTGQYYCATGTSEDSAEYFGVYLQVNQVLSTLVPFFSSFFISSPDNLVLLCSTHFRNINIAVDASPSMTSIRHFTHL